ncbi:MAG: NAD(P)/FAD-dependent oxidoreductase [Ferruginibacter sp.]|nr:NAD(P)/FAD-dependent oxidoreductase [Ferruginibacter sp.]
MKNKKLAVIGGGAAGFFCAINAAKFYPNLEVVILEKTGKLLSKVKVSGGGRCNVTHACFSIAEMIKKYPRGDKFLKKAFHHFFTTDTIAWFNERGVELRTEADGRMFPSTNIAQTIIDCLLKEATKYKVQIEMNTDIKLVQKENDKWIITTKNDKYYFADFVCLASGGLQKIEQCSWLTKLGHTIEEPLPSLFTFNIPKNEITKLMGLSVENVSVKIAGEKIQQEGPLLITHWGMSGPAILKTSAYAAILLAKRNYIFTAIVNWLPEYNEITLKGKMQLLRFEMATTKIQNRNHFNLPSRLWEYLLQLSDIKDDIRWADLPAKEENKLIKNLCAHAFEVKGKTTFKEEFVTAGGIRTEEIDVNTMQSKLHEGLFFAGEIINVDGVTGGFNFQNAWSTGWIAAKGIGLCNN